MKPELNNELKARLFAQYWGQKVMADKFRPDKTFEVVIPGSDRLYLKLRPITSITEKEAIEIGKAATNITTDWNSSQNKKYFKVKKDKYGGIEVSEKYSTREVVIDPVDGEINVYNDFDKQNVELDASATKIWAYQLMISFGICLPFMGYSVEDLVNTGWVRLA